MNFKSSRVEYPVETHKSNVENVNMEAKLSVNNKGDSII